MKSLKRVQTINRQKESELRRLHSQPEDDTKGNACWRFVHLKSFSKQLCHQEDQTEQDDLKLIILKTTNRSKLYF